jgi:hypothetical protein
MISRSLLTSATSGVDILTSLSERQRVRWFCSDPQLPILAACGALAATSDAGDRLSSVLGLLIVHAPKYERKATDVTGSAKEFGSSSDPVALAAQTAHKRRNERLPAANYDLLGRSAVSIKDCRSNITWTAHALVINSLLWRVTSDELFQSSKGRHPLPN